MRVDAIQVGDEVDIPGRRLHDDLGGLTVTFEVDAVDLDMWPGLVALHDRVSDSWAGFTAEDEFHVRRPAHVRSV